MKKAAEEISSQDPEPSLEEWDKDNHLLLSSDGNSWPAVARHSSSSYGLRSLWSMRAWIRSCIITLFIHTEAGAGALGCAIVLRACELDLKCTRVFLCIKWHGGLGNSGGAAA